jgi:hypothetical protein
MARILRSIGVGVAVIAAFVASGCAEKSSTPTGNDRVKPSYDKATGRLERITYDQNGDGRIDATTYMNGTAVIRAELDEDFDGKTDRWEHYGKGSGASSGLSARGLETGGSVLEKVESAGPDGKVTRWETYEGGVLRRAEEDTNGDGRVDKWETWERDELRMVALDTLGKGRPDRRLVYGAGGQGPQLEVDTKGTGTFTPLIEGQ